MPNEVGIIAKESILRAGGQEVFLNDGLSGPTIVDLASVSSQRSIPGLTIAIRDTSRLRGLMGGAALACCYLAEALSKIVRRVDVYSPEPEAFPHCNAIKVDTIHHASRVRRAFRMLQSLALPDARGFDCDGVIFPNQLEPLVGPHRGKRIVIMHDVIPLLFPREYPRLYVYYKFYLARALWKVDKIVTPSETSKKDLIKYYGLPPDRIQVIRNGFNSNLAVSEVDPKGDDPSPREAFGDYFLYIGGHLPHKNLHRLIHAVSIIRRHCNVNLVLAGPTDERYTPGFIETAKRCGMQDSLYILGMLSHGRLREILHHAMALVLPSLYEGFGMPSLEGMAAGIPVAASRCPPVREVCGDAAVHFDPLDIDDMARALEAVLTDEATRAACVKAGYERVKQFTWDRAGQEYASMIAALWERPSVFRQA